MSPKPSTPSEQAIRTRNAAVESFAKSVPRERTAQMLGHFDHLADEYDKALDARIAQRPYPIDLKKFGK